MRAFFKDTRRDLFNKGVLLEWNALKTSKNLFLKDSTSITTTPSFPAPNHNDVLLVKAPIVQGVGEVCDQIAESLRGM